MEAFGITRHWRAARGCAIAFAAAAFGAASFVSPQTARADLYGDVLVFPQDDAFADDAYTNAPRNDDLSEAPAADIFTLPEVLSADDAARWRQVEGVFSEMPVASMGDGDT